MIEAVGMDCVEQAVQQFLAMSRQKIYAGVFAFLQSLVGIKSVAERFGVASDDFALA